MVHLSKRCCYSNRWLWVRLNFADVLKMERYPLFSFFLFLGQKLTIVEQSCTLQGHLHWLLAMFWLPNSQTIYQAIQHYFDTYYCINILHNMCPEIIIMSSLTQQSFNSGYDNWLPSRKYVMSHFFQLNTNGKGKLINQIESNSRMRSTFDWIHVHSYHFPIYQLSILIASSSMVLQRTKGMFVLYFH